MGLSEVVLVLRWWSLMLFAGILQADSRNVICTAP